MLPKQYKLVNSIIPSHKTQLLFINSQRTTLSESKQREREGDGEKERECEGERESVNTFSFLIHSEAAGKKEHRGG